MMYRRALRLDMWFAVLLGVGWTLALATSFSRVVSGEYRALRWLAVVPVVLALVDLVEDALLLWIVKRHGGCGGELRRPDLVPIASSVTIAKWALAGLATAVSVVGYALLAWKGCVTCS